VLRAKQVGVALKQDGTVVAWGDNTVGQTSLPAGLSNVVAVAAGYYHSLALRSDGTVVAWGNNGSGQTNVPAGLSNVVAIAGGDSHSLALRSDGTVVAWGANYSDQTAVPAALSNVVAIASGPSHSLALQKDGTILAWGSNDHGQTDVPAGLSYVTAISAGGYYHSLALGVNSPPLASPQTVSGPANADLLITLSGSDLNWDLLTFRITALPGAGALYQSNRGARGAVAAPRAPSTVGTGRDR